MSAKVFSSNRNRLLGPLKPLESNPPGVASVRSWDVEIREMKRQIPHPVTPMMYNHAVVNLRNIPSSKDSCQEVVMLNRDTDSVEVLLMNDDEPEMEEEEDDDDELESVESEVSSISSNSILDTDSEYSNTTITTRLEEDIVEEGNDHHPRQEISILQENDSASAKISDKTPNPIITSPKKLQRIEDNTLLWSDGNPLESFHSHVPDIPQEISDIPLELSISVETGYSPQNMKQINDNKNKSNHDQSNENPLAFARNIRAKKRETDTLHKNQIEKTPRKNLFQRRVDSHIQNNSKSSNLHLKTNNDNQSLSKSIKRNVIQKETRPLSESHQRTLETETHNNKDKNLTKQPSSTIGKSPLKSRLGRVNKYYDVMSKKEQEKQERETMRLELKRQLTSLESRKKLDNLQSKTKHGQKVLGMTKENDSAHSSIDIPFKPRPLYSNDNSTPVKGVSLGRDLTPTGRRKLTLGTTNLPSSIMQNKIDNSSTNEPNTNSRYEQLVQSIHGKENCTENLTTNTKIRSFNPQKLEINTRDNDKSNTNLTKSSSQAHTVPRVSLGELTNRNDLKAKSMEYKEKIIRQKLQSQKLQKESPSPTQTTTENILSGKSNILINPNTSQKKQDDSHSSSSPRTVIRSVNALKSETSMTTQQKIEANHLLSSDASVYSEKSNFSKKSQEYLSEEERQRSFRRKQRLISLIHHAITCEAEGLFDTGPSMVLYQDAQHSDATYRMLQHARRCQFDEEECEVPSCKRFKAALRHYLRCKSRNGKNGKICHFCDALPKTL